MGQYYVAVNLSKRQVIRPHAFGDGAKLLEFGCSGAGMMCGLAILLADGNGRGGGDLRSEHPIIGTWAGDDIVISGDYADAKRFTPADAADDANLYSHAGEHFEDVSIKVIEALCDDAYVLADLAKSLWWRGDDDLKDYPPKLVKAIRAERKVQEKERAKRA